MAYVHGYFLRQIVHNDSGIFNLMRGINDGKPFPAKLRLDSLSVAKRTAS